MNLRGSSSFILVLLTCAVAMGGDLRVSGEVTGTWVSGSRVIVEGPSYVPAAGSLTIEPDVIITFECDAAFQINGGFSAFGAAGHPIVLQPTGSWDGLFFAPYPELREMQWVRVDTSLALPKRVVVSQACDIGVESCVLIGVRSGFEARGGHVTLHDNLMISRGRFSKTVILEDLASDPLHTPPCSPQGHSSRVTDNIFAARCEYDPMNDWYPRDAYTSAMAVERSTNLCLSENTFTVEAPWTCVGIHFGELPANGDPVWYLNYGTVAVRSFDGMPLGINKANEGYLLAVRCNLDVGKLFPDNYYTSTGVRASHEAQIVLNSSALLLDEGDNFFMSVSGALLTVDYNTHWTTGTSGTEGMGQPEVRAALDADDSRPGVIYGLHNINANPMFAMDGAWGRWESKGDVRRYYSLLAGSPCIDAGDTLYGRDTDGSFPDIGHFPFEGMSVGNPREYPTTIADMSMGSAYPNPFNMTTTVPFELRAAGLLTFTVYDVIGRTMVSEVVGPLTMGRHEIVWDAANAGSGTYFVTLGLNGVRVGSQAVYLVK